MFTSELFINVLVLTGIILLSMLAGFGLRSRQLGKKDARIRKLEQEMIETHAEILEAQKEYCELESKYRGPKIPVIKTSPSLGKDRPTRIA
ncbi:MAG TPA: hypothetical protein VK563_07800 [Puia sp.]|nr:hypothetical protein [Puia sp.]